MASDSVRRALTIRELFDVRRSLKMMATSPNIDEEEKGSYIKITQALSTSNDQHYLNDRFNDYGDLCRNELKNVIDYGGVMALRNVDRCQGVVDEWKRVWEHFHQNFGIPENVAERGLYDFLLVNYEIAPIDLESLYTFRAPSVPPLKDWKSWRSSFKSILHQRYEQQCGFTFTGVKKKLEKSNDRLKDEALVYVDKVAPECHVGNGQWLLHFNTGLYKIPLGLDIKAKCYTDQLRLSVDDECGRVLFKCLSEDDDLRNSIGLTLKRFLDPPINQDTISFITQMIIDLSFNSDLKFVYKNLVPDELVEHVAIRRKVAATSKLGEHSKSKK